MPIGVGFDAIFVEELSAQYFDQPPVVLTSCRPGSFRGCAVGCGTNDPVEAMGESCGA